MNLYIKESSEENMCIEADIDKLASRHIARLLTRLGKTIEPVHVSEIKREFRFLADDIKQVINTEISDGIHKRL